MMKKRNLLLSMLLIMAAMFASHTVVFAQKDQVEGFWLNEEKDAKIEIYKAKNGKYYGKIVWLKEPDRNGKPKLDEKNADAKLRTQPIMGLLILKGFEKDGNEYDDGTIYDPKNGKTYSCTMTYKNANTLNIRGYVGVSLLGRTTVWTRSK